MAVVEATEGVALEEENLRSLRLINHKTPLTIAGVFDVAVNRTCKILQHFSHFLSLSDVEVHVEASVSSSTSVRNLFREVLRGFEAVPLIESGPRLQPSETVNRVLDELLHLPCRISREVFFVVTRPSFA